MKSLEQSLFGDYTNEEIKNWLNSSEHYWFIKGGKRGIWIGFVFGMLPWIYIGLLLSKFLLP